MLKGMSTDPAAEDVTAAGRGRSPLGVALVGCGDIAKAYGETLRGHGDLVAIRGAYDRNPPRVAAFVEANGGVGYESLDALLADPRVDAVVNLTRQTGHYELTARCLDAGKHVYSEKPVAMTHAEAGELVALAEQHGLRLAAAPITFLGEAQQTVWERVADGAIGTVRIVYAEANWGQIERWHPRPAPFYDAGAVFDVGVYPLTLVTAMLGPAVRVRAHGATVLPERTTLEGERFTVGAPDWTVALVGLAGGALMRLTTTFYVERASRQQGIELHGDGGMLALDSWHTFDAGIAFAPAGQWIAEPLEPARTPFAGVDYGRGVAELADALASGRPHRGDGAHAAHVVENMAAIHASIAADGAPVELSSTFAPPALQP
jgi:predicted dehydrogenase